jgi:GT2 family glycosyltransferase
MIPVIGIPHYGEWRHTEKLLASIPRDRVELIHIVDNTPSYGRIEVSDPQVVISRPWRNIGVAAAWNAVIKWNPEQRWWFLVNNDIVLSEENLDAIERAMRLYDAATFGGMHAFGIRQTAIQKVGWFDENFAPCYFEDNDWDYRARLLNVHVEKGLGPVAHHYGSAVIRDSEKYRSLNGRTFPMNQRYYEQKWGGSVDHEVYTTPFNRGGSPREWTLDINRLANQSWKE